MEVKGLYWLKDNYIKPYDIDESKRIIMCGVPGAFTENCTYEHLPGFVNKLDELKELGIDKVVFVSVNDAYVMWTWNKMHGHKDIDSVSDPIAEFAKSKKKDLDWGKTFGVRSSRYAYLWENGKIVKEFKDPYIDGVIKEL